MLKLFDNSKDLIHRLANLILVLWLVISILVSYNYLINMIVKKDNGGYSEYKRVYCTDVDNKTCDNNYQRMTLNNKNADYNNKKGFVNGIGNIVFVSLSIYFVNRKKD